KAHLDLIGHIPHDISIDHALHVGHMRTVEHLKGFLLDRTLMVSTEDYEKATSGIEYWQVPTLYTYLGQWPLHGAAATAQQALPEMQYVAVDRRVRWAKASAEAADKDDKLRTLLLTAQHAAVDRLLPLHPHWLAGTDAAGYDYNVAGYALLDELDLMVAFHIPEADVLRAATSEPALAMRRNDFGKVERPMRADLVLLAADPTKDIRAFRNSRGVVVRGRWLDRPS